MYKLMKEYNEIKQNIIEKFLNPLYKFVTLHKIELIADDINKRLPFEVIYTKDDSMLSFFLGNDVKVFVTVVIENKGNKSRIIGFE